MLKKIALAIVAMALLLGTENLIAHEGKGKPKEKQKHMQKQKAQAKQFHKQQPGKKAGRKCTEGEIFEQQGPVFGQMHNRPMMGKRFDKWFNQLTKAYHENDREKMGQLLRKMRQLRQRRRAERDALGEHRRYFPSEPGFGRGRGGIGRGRPWRFRGDLGRCGRDFPHRGMMRWGRGFQRRGVGRRGHGMPYEAVPPEGMCRPEMGFPPRDMGESGHKFRHRGMNAPRWDDVPSSEWDW